MFILFCADECLLSHHGSLVPSSVIFFYININIKHCYFTGCQLTFFVHRRRFFEQKIQKRSVFSDASDRGKRVFGVYSFTNIFYSMKIFPTKNVSVTLYDCFVVVFVGIMR